MLRQCHRQQSGRRLDSNTTSNDGATVSNVTSHSVGHGCTGTTITSSLSSSLSTMYLETAVTVVTGPIHNFREGILVTQTRRQSSYTGQASAGSELTILSGWLSSMLSDTSINTCHVSASYQAACSSIAAAGFSQSAPIARRPIIMSPWYIALTSPPVVCTLGPIPSTTPAASR